VNLSSFHDSAGNDVLFLPAQLIRDGGITLRDLDVMRGHRLYLVLRAGPHDAGRPGVASTDEVVRRLKALPKARTSLQILGPEARPETRPNFLPVDAHAGWRVEFAGRPASRLPERPVSAATAWQESMDNRLELKEVELGP
jgi:hypothetical protein